MVSNATVVSVSEVPLTEQVILPKLHLGSISNGNVCGAPVLRQFKSNVLIDDVGSSSFELGGIDVLRVYSLQGLTIDCVGSVARSLAGT